MISRGPLRAFLSHFPVPEFLSQPAVGCDVSEHAARFISLGPDAGALGIRRYGSAQIPSGAIVNGEIRDRVAVIAALRDLQNGEQIPYAHASLPAEKAFLFDLEIPGVGLSVGAVRSIVEFKLEENVPISPQEALFDCTVVGENRNAGTTRVSVTALAAQTAEEYRSLLNDAGIRPVSFEVGADAVARSVAPAGETGTIMAVDIGSQKTGLSIITQGVTLFTSSLDVGGDRLTRAIVQALSLSFEEAEERKKKEGLVPGSGHRKMFVAIAEHMSVLKDEMNRHLAYWRDTHRGAENTIRRIVFCGGGANLPGLTDFLSPAFFVPVSIADVWANVCPVDECIPDMSLSESLSYATAVGLALREFSR